MFKIKSTLLHGGRNGMLLLLAGLAISVTGCGTENDLDTSDTSSTVTLPKMATPASLTTTSAADYDDNIYGLITGATLANWITDWAANKPPGLATDSKLIILQTSAGESASSSQYIDSTASGVFTYLVGSSEWVETRSNGVVETVSMVPSGKTMDAFLSRYNIDPGKDMVVCAQGTAGAGQSMRAGRCWYMLRYWGMNKGQIAVLNGGNEWNATNNALAMSTTADIAPETGTASVKDLPAINFALQATLEDMVNIVPTTDTNVLDDGVFIWDARGNGTLGTSGNEYSPDDDTDFRNGGATQGHPNGALMLTYTNLLNTTAGYTYKTKAEIQSYLDGDVDGSSIGFAGADLQAVGVNSAYQAGDVVYTYCETTFRAMITGFASAGILGLPTRFYDGAMTEWHSMANVVASDGNAILPLDSPWRTDKSSISMFLTHSDPASISPRNITNAYASHAQAVIIEDLAYKGIIVETGSSSTDDTSSGGVLPANPCGG